MAQPDTKPTPDDTQERKALEESEKKASEKQPGSFKEEAETEKIVEVLPLDQGVAPIKGLDPKEQTPTPGKSTDQPAPPGASAGRAH